MEWSVGVGVGVGVVVRHIPLGWSIQVYLYYIIM